MTPPPDCEPPDALRFAFARSRSLGSAAAALLRNPVRAFGVLSARLTGKRLRSRQKLAALVGIDHRLSLPASTRPGPEPASAHTAEGIDILTAATPGSGTAPIAMLLPSGHRLVAGASAAIATAFREDAGLQALYGDALVIGEDGTLLPILRPAFDPDFLRSIDFVGPALALRRSSLDMVGRDLVPGAEAADLLLRIDARFGTGAVRHLPQLISVWDLKDDVVPRHEAHLAAVRADLVRRGDDGARSEMTRTGTIRIERPLPEPRPLVSLIVPTRDRLDLLRPCLAGLVDRTDWPDREILICDNDSREPETLAFLRDLEARGIARTILCPGPFDFAGMNNRAAEAARGSVLAFVNNDVEAFRPDWLERMVREALRPEIGAVGAKLLDGEGRVQHGGIVLGTGGGLVTHGHRHFAGDAPGYLGALLATHRVSAVTAACLVVEARKFRTVGGFDATRFSVDFNDVDLCLRLNAADYRTLLVSSAVLHHREAASRRRSPASEARHRQEIAHLRERWGALLAQDPHYHPGFDPDLSTHARLRKGWTGFEPVCPRAMP